MHMLVTRIVIGMIRRHASCLLSLPPSHSSTLMTQVLSGHDIVAGHGHTLSNSVATSSKSASFHKEFLKQVSLNVTRCRVRTPCAAASIVHQIIMFVL